jgi:hypothetical protein
VRYRIAILKRVPVGERPRWEWLRIDGRTLYFDNLGVAEETRHRVATQSTVTRAVVREVETK